ncbi:aminotransferase class IV [Cytophaga hutchinsonii]|uniref:branched-chain-amino-acid transaminase n=1 Tax=Cytophaga hutchinsonii (strain ATCC 33406 / DSM 1761 / CIP 103989 / NBRC 15051 / NCIMB 9469 / D465) TaxID=269798 RepID=A0A6N4SQH0_CYTH3|nr:aminotransferase class IV [Cytophaga hutchinsonii]ABG58574.1 branched chain amino acid: 2-keto-4-methylthiobutyrate aminotransferase [Cytophaga hutchinsonii ATCC 33406]SFX77377.1 4-amino-4-deoxychorismate lyase [Cytophaga hutchinsonii ATCC 33406]
MIIYSNGQFIPDSEALFTIDNRAFQYGDGVFETMLYKNNSIRYFSDHFSRLQKSMACMELTNEICSNETELENIIHELIKKNGYGADVRIKLMVHRNWGGLYAPESTNGILTVLVKEHIASNQISKEYVVFSDDVRNHYYKGSMYKLLSSGRYVLAGLEMKRRKANDIIITDIDGNVSECLQANLFWIKNNTIYTPGIETGCIDGVMRKQIQQYCAVTNIEFKTGFYNITELEKSDIVFAGNVAGLTPFAQIEKVKFRTEHELFDKLKKHLT